MTDAIPIENEDILTQARQLVEYLEQGKADEAVSTLESLSAVREKDLFQELGKLTRELHDTINSFQLDAKISDMAANDIPDAKERLTHVITMTEQAADKTLNAVERTLPVSEELVAKALQLGSDWERFRGRDMDVEEFRKLSGELDEFFGWLGESTPIIQSSLTEILMAQDFQDLTGQIIRRVITLVQDVEHSLVDLVRITGQKMKPVAEEKKSGPDIEAVGPAVPGVDKGDVVSGQDDVDDLLSSLGF